MLSGLLQHPLFIPLACPRNRERYTRSPEEGQQIAQRAFETLARRIPYDVLGIKGLNCDQTANYHQRGQPVSPSLWVLGVLGAVLALAYARSS
jgi:hypothetical protein